MLKQSILFILPTLLLAAAPMANANLQTQAIVTVTCGAEPQVVNLQVLLGRRSGALEGLTSTFHVIDTSSIAGILNMHQASATQFASDASPSGLGLTIDFAATTAKVMVTQNGSPRSTLSLTCSAQVTNGMFPEDPKFAVKEVSLNECLRDIVQLLEPAGD